MMNIDRSNLERKLFKLTMWLIVSCSIIAIATKVLINKPSTVPFHYLLIIAMLAALLSILVPNLESYVLSRISEINVGGVKLVIAQAETIRDQLKFDEIPPDSVTESNRADQPFPLTELKGFQRYEYEKLSYKLYQVFDQIKDPNDLSPGLRENYRKLLKHVGKAAFSMKHYTKYLDIVLHLRLFTDRGLYSDELYLIAHAYLWAADEQLEDSKQKVYLNESLPLLNAAIEKNPYDVKIPFSLGVALLRLSQYDKGIEFMQICMKMYKPITPWAKWNIACGLKKQGKDQETLVQLEEIPAGLWWEDIAKDDWFKDPNNAQFENSFKALCEKKINDFENKKPL